MRALHAVFTISLASLAVIAFGSASNFQSATAATANDNPKLVLGINSFVHPNESDPFCPLTVEWSGSITGSNWPAGMKHQVTYHWEDVNGHIKPDHVLAIPTPFVLPSTEGFPTPAPDATYRGEPTPAPTATPGPTTAPDIEEKAAVTRNFTFHLAHAKNVHVRLVVTKPHRVVADTGSVYFRCH